MVYGEINLFLLLLHCSSTSPARRVASSTVQSITITSRKDNIKEEEQRSPTEPQPSPTVPSSSAPSSPSVSPPSLSPPAQPSLLATLLARKKSTVTVPASKEVSPPQRGTNRLSPDRLLYTPHSPFHLFSYDLDEGPSLVKPSEESPKTTDPRLDGVLQLLLSWGLPRITSLSHHSFLLKFPFSL